MPGQSSNADRTSSSTRLSRRRLLNQAASAGAVALAARSPIRAEERAGSGVLGANERVGVGIIGSGGMGRGHMNNFKKLGAEWIGVCDVYKPNLEAGMEIAGKNAVAYHEHEKLLDNKDIDAVVIGSPEHWHHDHLLATLDAGKDAYCEKPMCHSIEEGQSMVNAVRKTDRIVQIGMQRRSSETIRQIKEEVFDEGLLGDIHIVRAEWYWDWHIGSKMSEVNRGDLDWERFCGPAGKQEYEPLKYRAWRYYWPFSGGNETDQGTHLMDVVQWMMGADTPRSAVQFGDVYYNQPTETPDTFCCTFEYPNFMATWTLCYASNRYRNGWSITFQGLKGSLFLTEAGYRIFDQVNGWEDGWPKRAKEHLPGGLTRTEPHIQNFLDCIKSRKQPNAPAEIGHKAVRPLHLANAALRANRRAFLEPDGASIRLA